MCWRGRGDRTRFAAARSGAAYGDWPRRREQMGADRIPEWVAEGPRGRLIVDFPPQHIAETVLSSGGSSSRARLAGPSSLHFNITNQRVRLSVEGLLAAMTQLSLRSDHESRAKPARWSFRGGCRWPSSRSRVCKHRRKPASTAGGVTELSGTPEYWGLAPATCGGSPVCEPVT